MKKLLFLLSLFLITWSFAQTSKDSILFFTSSSASIYPVMGSDCYPVGSSNKKYSPKNLLFITNISECNRYGTKKDVLEVYFDGSKHYLLADNTETNIFMLKGNESSLDDFKKLIVNRNAQAKDSADHYAKIISEVYMRKLIKESSEKITSKKKYGIGILKANPTEDYSMTGADFRIINFSKKTIKYITFNFYGKNAVNDRVGANVSRKGIGPIEELQTGTWSFDTVWLTDIVQTLKLISVNIIYMDGSTKAIPITDNHWMDEDDLDNFDKLIEE